MIHQEAQHLHHRQHTESGPVAANDHHLTTDHHQGHHSFDLQQQQQQHGSTFIFNSQNQNGGDVILGGANNNSNNAVVVHQLGHMGPGGEIVVHHQQQAVVHHHQLQEASVDSAGMAGEAGQNIMSALDMGALEQGVVPIDTNLVGTQATEFDESDDNPYKKKVALAKQFLLNNFEHDPRSSFPKRRLYHLYQILVPDEESQLAYNRLAIVVNQFFEQPERKTRKKSLENLPPGTPISKKRKRSKLFEGIRLKPHLSKVYDEQLDERMKNYEKLEKVPPRRKNAGGASTTSSNNIDDLGDEIDSDENDDQSSVRVDKKRRFDGSSAAGVVVGGVEMPPGTNNSTIGVSFTGEPAEAQKPQVFVRSNPESYLIMINSFGLDTNSLECSITPNCFKIKGKYPTLPSVITDHWPSATSIGNVTFPTSEETFEILLTFPSPIDMENTQRNRELEESEQTNTSAAYLCFVSPKLAVAPKKLSL